MFRVDRIRDATGTGEHFEPRGLQGAGRPLYDRSSSDVTVRLLLHPASRWVGEYYETSEQREQGDDLEVAIPTRSLAWVSKLLVRLGDGAQILEPDELKDRVRDLASRTLDLYR